MVPPRIISFSLLGIALVVVDVVGMRTIPSITTHHELDRLDKQAERDRQQVERWAASQPPKPDEAKKSGPRMP